MRLFAITMASCALAACASKTPVGDDNQGLRLKAAATPVLHALVKYKKDNREYPRSLFELTPKYIAAVPFEPGLQYHRDEQVILFEYESGWLTETVCLARPGDVEWVCKK